VHDVDLAGACQIKIVDTATHTATYTATRTATHTATEVRIVVDLTGAVQQFCVNGD